MSVRDSFDSMVRHRVGTRDNIKFWMDSWVRDYPLSSQFPNLFRCAQDVLVMVRDYYSKIGDQVVWAPMFRRNLNEGEIQDFATLLTVLSSVFIADGRKDKRVWTGTIDGSFSLASFFLALRGGAALDLSKFPFEEVWKSKAPPKVGAFAWLVISNVVLTMDNLRRPQHYYC